MAEALGTAAPGPGGRRADYERNARRILDAASRVLVDQPDAPMADVAAAAGVHRATLYRHFPEREDLIAALHRRAMEEAAEAIDAARPEEGPALEALERILTALAALGDRYRVLLREGGHLSERDPGEKTRLGARLVALAARGQAAGEIRGDVPPLWVVEAVFAVMTAGLRMVSEGTLVPEEIPGLVRRTVLEGIRPREAAAA